jgi:hypothetical protein
MRGAATPQLVNLEFGEKCIELADTRGQIEEIAYAWLKVREDRGGSIVVGRKWSPGFRLHLNGEAARIARDLLQPAPWLTRAGRWALGSPKAALIILALPYFVIDSLPSTWLARAAPTPFSRGIEATAIGEIDNLSCSSPGGNNALKALVGLIASEAEAPKAMVINQPSFIVSARPGGELLIYRSATTEVDSEVLAAMIAHAMAHQQAGHVRIAVARGEGSDYLGRLTAFRFSRNLVSLTYSAEEESAADRAAIAMLRRAGISIKPAADFFARIDQAEQEARYWAQEYSRQHPGIANRARTWAAAAAAQHNSHAALSERQADELFNICWKRPSSVRPKWEPRAG